MKYEKNVKRKRIYRKFQKGLAIHENAAYYKSAGKLISDYPLKN